MRLLSGISAANPIPTTATARVSRLGAAAVVLRMLPRAPRTGGGAAVKADIVRLHELQVRAYQM